MTGANETLATVAELVEQYDTDRHRVGSDLLAHHYLTFWRKVKAALEEQGQ